MKDIEIEGYLAGPYPVAEVRRPPDLLRRLLREMGIKITDEQIADYERGRAFTGYEGIIGTVELGLHADLQPPSSEAVPLPAGRARRKARPTRGAPSPEDVFDLGDG